MYTLIKHFISMCFIGVCIYTLLKCFISMFLTKIACSQNMEIVVCLTALHYIYTHIWIYVWVCTLCKKLTICRLKVFNKKYTGQNMCVIHNVLLSVAKRLHV